MSETDNYVFGANIIENLTTGMYQDSRVIFREYIQNASDSIDQAVADGLLQANEGKIEIWLEPQSNRTVVIQDNGTGISSADFHRILCGIGNSEKQMGKNRGFRGIGRLCGLAYCKELVFKTKTKGETTVSIMRFNAAEMRALIAEHNKGNKKEAEAVLQQVGKFEKSEDENVNEHYFQVTLKNVNDENTDLLDAPAIKEYLSFVAPIPYQNTFPFRRKIRDHAVSKGYKIDEYIVKLDGEQVFKGYSDKIKDSSGNVSGEIFSIEFKDFFDDSGNLLAWLWMGVSKFEKVLPKRHNPMRSFRLRKHNIQIGGEDTLQKLFKEDRGQNYFVGEVFAVSPDLIPNSQRNYFNENPVRKTFEDVLRDYFQDELHQVYYGASRINSAVRKNEHYEQAKKDFAVKEQQGTFFTDKHKQEEHQKLETKRQEAEKAEKEIAKIEEKANESGGGKILKQVINKVKEDAKLKPTPLPSVKPIRKKLTDKLDGKYTSKERKIIERIFETIHSVLEEEQAKNLIEEIMKALRAGLKK